MAVKVKREQTNIPSYIPGKPNDMPFFLEKKPYQGATGRIYPVPFVDKINNNIQDKDYDLIKLENDYIEVELLPELGGKIHGATAKADGYEFIYKNIVIYSGRYSIRLSFSDKKRDKTIVREIRSDWFANALSNAACCL